MIHETLQICVLPLGPDFKPSMHHPHFEILIKPENVEKVSEEADKVNRGLLTRCAMYGIERWAAVEAMREWFYKLRLPEQKKIVPLAANYQHDRDFIREFMGGASSYEELFRSDYRDVQEAARVVNDMSDFHSERIPFPKTNLGYLCATLGVDHINKHDATGDCLATAEVYRRLMRYKDYHNPIPIPEPQIFDTNIDQLLHELDNMKTGQAAKRQAVRLFMARTGRHV